MDKTTNVRVNPNAAVIPQTLWEAVNSEDRNNRALNQESIAIGDRVTIEALPEKLSSFATKDSAGNDTTVEFCSLVTRGDRRNLSLGALVGTNKRNKWFNAAERAGNVEIADGFDINSAFELSTNREADVLVEIAENYIGTTFQCEAIATECGARGNRTFYLWSIVNDSKKK
jgi:hypothetical protein